MVAIKRIYDPFDADDGYRILVDRLWPRGVKKDTAHIDRWMKEVAPTNELRKWFGHEPAKWDGFNKAYEAELQHSPAIEELASIVKEHKKVTLLYGAKDTKHTHALVLQRLLG